MLDKLRPRSVYDVLAAIAFVIAVAGGTAYAAANIGPNDIQNNAVRSRHINDGAVHAADVDQGLLASLRPHCPAGLHRAGDICFEPTAHPGGTGWEDALRTCARAQLRLPNAGELALVFDHLGAPQHNHWVANAYFDANGTDVKNYAGAIMEEPDRSILSERTYLTDTNTVFRCVTSATNSP